MKPKLISDFLGQKFGMLTIIGDGGIKKHHLQAQCQCDCGTIKEIRLSRLRRGETKSCGCSTISRKHGLFGTRFYGIWASMKRRCSSPKCERYKNYGGRGIKVCNEWLDFENFMNDMYKSYLEHVKKFGEGQTTLGRINNDGNYNKKNCEWETWKKQACNTTRNKWFKAISPTGKIYMSKNQKEFAQKHQLKQETISQCLQRTNNKLKSGWTFIPIDI